MWEINFGSDTSYLSSPGGSEKGFYFGYTSIMLPSFGICEQ